MSKRPNHLRPVSQYPQMSGGTIPIPTEFWEGIDPAEAAEVYSWDADNVPEGALGQAISIARATGDTALIELLWRDDPFEP